MANIYGIDLGTCNIKIFSKHSNKIIKEKNPLRLLTRISYMHMAMKHMLCMKKHRRISMYHSRLPAE